MSLPNIETLDTDGALREAEERVAGDTRAAFFRKAAVGGGAVLGSGAILGMLPTLAHGAPSKKQDLEILNYALTLEYLEAAYYTEAKVSGVAKQFAKIVGKHERIHVAALKKTIKALGGTAVAEPKFDFKGTNEDNDTFIATATVLENTGVYAYHGQIANILNGDVLVAAAQIATVEARHAGAVAVLLNDQPFKDKADTSITVAGAFDTGKSMNAILKAVGKTGFIQG